MGGRGKHGVRGREVPLGPRAGVAGFQSSASMKPLLALVLAAMAAPCVFGTAQSPDILILDGKEVPLFENPLEWLWLTENGEPVLEA